jgi:NAD(P)H-dependent nitrite reductase small subunit
MSDEGEVWVAAASLDEVPEPGVLGVQIGKHELAIYRLLGGEVCATDNVCTHGAALLSEGWLTDEGCIECPLHAGQFDIRTGKGMGPPIDEDIRTYPVKVEDGLVLVRLGRP